MRPMKIPSKNSRKRRKGSSAKQRGYGHVLHQYLKAWSTDMRLLHAQCKALAERIATPGRLTAFRTDYVLPVSRIIGSLYL
jgi:hypothetical protein